MEQGGARKARRCWLESGKRGGHEASTAPTVQQPHAGRMVGLEEPIGTLFPATLAGRDPIPHDLRDFFHPILEALAPGTCFASRPSFCEGDPANQSANRMVACSERL
jgi:hypothetical protein